MVVRVLGVQNSQLRCKFRADDLYFCLKGRKLLGSTGAFKNCHTSLPHHNTQTHIHLHTHSPLPKHTHTFRNVPRCLERPCKSELWHHYVLHKRIGGGGRGRGPLLCSRVGRRWDVRTFFFVVVACQIISPPPPIEMARGATSNGKWRHFGTTYWKILHPPLF